MDLTDWLILIPIAATAAWYARGTAVVWQRFGRWRGARPTDLLTFWTGLGLLTLAVASPLHDAAGTSFAAHMLQHCILTVVAPPLLVVGRTDAILLYPLPSPLQRRLGRFAHGVSRGIGAGGALAIFTVVFWAWHEPTLYDAAVGHTAIHAFEHVTMFLSALLFWHPILRRSGTRQLHYGIALLLVFISMLQMSVLSGLLIFSGSVWYPAYAHGPAAALSSLDDQRLGGLVMWGLSSAVAFTTIAALLVRWFAAEERRALTAASSVRAIRQFDETLTPSHQ